MKHTEEHPSHPRIMIWTNKGGQGKTALALALAMEFDFPVITNDVHSPIDAVLPEGDAYHLKRDEAMPVVPPGNKIIFDMGGNAETRVVDAAKQADVVLMPVIYNSPQEMKVFLESISEMLAINRKIVLVANACQRGKFKETKAIVNQYFPGLTMLEIKKSTAFARAVEEKKSIEQLIKEHPFKYRMFKDVSRQLAFLADVLDFEAGNPAKAVA